MCAHVRGEGEWPHMQGDDGDECEHTSWTERMTVRAMVRWEITPAHVCVTVPYTAEYIF